MRAFGILSTIPSELSISIFKQLSPASLAALCTTNKAISNVATSILYGTIVLDLHTTSCLDALLCNPELALLTRRLHVEWQRTDPDQSALSISLAGNMGQKLRSALKMMKNLNDLSLHSSVFDSLSSLMTAGETFPFSLTKFATSLTCDAALEEFLVSQPTIRHLGLYSGLDDPNFMDATTGQRAIPFRQISPLRSLFIGPQTIPDVIACIIRATAPTLEEIHITFEDRRDIEITLDILHNALTFRGKLGLRWDLCYMPLDNLFSLLSKAVPCVRQLSIENTSDDALEVFSKHQIQNRSFTASELFAHLEVFILRVDQPTWRKIVQESHTVRRKVENWLQANKLRFMRIECDDQSFVYHIPRP